MPRSGSATAYVTALPAGMPLFLALAPISILLDATAMPRKLLNWTCAPTHRFGPLRTALSAPLEWGGMPSTCVQWKRRGIAFSYLVRTECESP